MKVQAQRAEVNSKHAVPAIIRGWFAQARMIFALWSLSATIALAYSGEITVGDRALVVSGVLARGDFDKFKRLLESNEGVRRIIFQNCYGGATDEGARIAEFIRQRKMHTFAKSQVQSSCAFAFLAGDRRQFDAGFGAHLILLHGAHNEDPLNDVASRVNEILIPYIESLSHKKMPPLISRLILQSSQPGQGVVFVQKNWLIARMHETLYCDGTRRSLAECRSLSQFDALQLGIVTEVE
ncbi:hypothetical protein J7E62_14795 [Variovorax paradoxus]|nr:hypothetical protein [Variovorax paradoxus]